MSLGNINAASDANDNIKAHRLQQQPLDSRWTHSTAYHFIANQLTNTPPTMQLLRQFVVAAAVVWAVVAAVPMHSASMSFYLSVLTEQR